MYMQHAIVLDMDIILVNWNTSIFQVQFWRLPDWPGRHVDIWVPKATKQSLMNELKKHDILYEIKVTDWNITKDDVTMENIDFFDKKYQKFHQVIIKQF